MTSHLGRLYTLAIAVLVFFLVWALVAAKPWKTAAPDPRLQVLTLREQALKRETALVNQILRQRTVAAKSVQAASGQTASPAVRVVTLPPLTVTRSS